MSRQGKKRDKNFDNIKTFWEKEANEWGQKPQVTIRDHYFRLHEINILINLIPYCTTLLDIGCGTGFQTIFFSKKANKTLGIDYSDNMIKWAQNLINDEKYRDKIFKKYGLDGNIQIPNELNFETGDILNLNLNITNFDVITGQRILINLPSHQDQMKALKNLWNYATKGALLILTEATMQGHQRTDKYRQSFGLSKLEKYWHNNYVDESKYNDWINYGWSVKKLLNFDTYMLLSKVIYPAACGETNCTFLSGVNKASMEMANLFRTKQSIDEIGFESFFELFFEKIKNYDNKHFKPIKNWVFKNQKNISNWESLGHQRLIIAEAI